MVGLRPGSLHVMSRILFLMFDFLPGLSLLFNSRFYFIKTSSNVRHGWYQFMTATHHTTKYVDHCRMSREVSVVLFRQNLRQTCTMVVESREIKLFTGPEGRTMFSALFPSISPTESTGWKLLPTSDMSRRNSNLSVYYVRSLLLHVLVNALMCLKVRIDWNMVVLEKSNTSCSKRRGVCLMSCLLSLSLFNVSLRKHASREDESTVEREKGVRYV